MRNIKEKPGGLTERQRAFVHEVVRDESIPAYRAYRNAGFKAKNDNVARVMSSRLLAKPHIKKEIKRLRERRAHRLEINEVWVLRKLIRNYRRAMQDIPVLDAEGNPTGTYTYNGAVANRSLELIGKHLGMFSDRLKIEGEVKHKHVHAHLDVKSLPLELTRQLVEHFERLEQQNGNSNQPAPNGTQTLLPLSVMRNGIEETPRKDNGDLSSLPSASSP